MTGKLKLTLPILKALRYYDQETGWFHYLNGKRSGYLHRSNATRVYVVVDLGPYGRHYAHRLAHFYMTGTWPAALMDHKNNDGTYNAWANLRPASRGQNGWNTKVRSCNKTGVTGVTYDPIRQKWRYDLRYSGNRVYGRFNSREEAVEARLDAERRYFVW